MQTILVANPKGGSGKTTLATNVAGWLAGKRQRVALADHDPQQLGHGVAGAAAGALSGDRGRSAPTRQEGREGRGSQWLVVDTPAGLHGDELRDARAPRRRDAGAALAVGVRHGGDPALSRSDREYKAVSEGELAIGIVAMRVDARTRSAAELDEFLESIRLSARRASARYAGVRALRARRRDGVRPAALAWRAGLGAMEAADALDRAARAAEVRLSRRRGNANENAGVRAGVLAFSVALGYFFGAIAVLASARGVLGCVGGLVGGVLRRVGGLVGGFLRRIGGLVGGFLGCGRGFLGGVLGRFGGLVADSLALSAASVADFLASAAALLRVLPQAASVDGERSGGQKRRVDGISLIVLLYVCGIAG